MTTTDRPTSPADGSDAAPAGSAPREIRVAFWNVQNLFDPECSAIAAELEFTPAFGWNRSAFETRTRNIAEVIRQMFDGQGPDLLGLCEVESEQTARRLLKELGRSDYCLAHVEHPGFDALDTTLIYSDRVFEFLPRATRGHLIHPRFATRDIFEAGFRIRASHTELTVLVNHWPSERERPVAAACLRIAAAEACARIINRLLKLPRRAYLELNDTDIALYELNQAWNRNVLLMGDFNDDPWADSLRCVLRGWFSRDAIAEPLRMIRGSLPSWRAYSRIEPALFNPMPSLLAVPDQGTVYRPDRIPAMSLSDQFLLSRGLYFGCRGLQPVCRPGGTPDVAVFRPSMMTDRHGRPRPYSRADQTGVSDHFPITMTLSTTSDHDAG